MINGERPINREIEEIKSKHKDAKQLTLKAINIAKFY